MATLIIIVLVLVAEQVHPLNVVQWVERPLAGIAAHLERQFNDGNPVHGTLAWVMGAAVPAAAVLAIHWLLASISALLGFVFAFVVLYLTMGFRQFSHHFTAIQLALQAGDIEFARKQLAEWSRRRCERLSGEETARLAIETGLAASHRHVFAPLLAFALLGPAGALLYRLAERLATAWGSPDGEEADATFGRFAMRAFVVIDWLPVRATATAFAVVGDFEDAVYCWRAQAARWRGVGSGILLSSGAGALGVKLGMPVQDDVAAGERSELGLGEPADADFMQGTIGLVWRTLVLSLVLLALFAVSGWIRN